MDTRTETCEARISAHMESREADFAALFAIAAGDKIECPACEGSGETVHEPDGVRVDLVTDCEQCDGTGEVTPTYDGEPIDQDGAMDRLAELPLGISVKRVLRIDLSTGGPGDWIEADLDDDNEVDAVVYHFNDWFDHAESRVDEGSALWRAAEHYAEYVGHGE